MHSRLIARSGSLLAILIGCEWTSTRAQIAPPGNDLYANRAIVSGTRAEFSGTLYGSTVEFNEYLPFMGDGSVWYRWVAPSSGIATITAAAIPKFSTLAVFRGGVNFNSFDFTTVLAQMDNPIAPSLDFRARGGESYVFGFFGDASLQSPASQFTLDLSGPVAAPANDHFANAIQLAGTQADFSGTSYGATVQIAENNFGASDNVGTVWWRWTAAASGYLRISHREPIPDPLRGIHLVVLRGETLGSQTELGTFSGFTSYFRVTEGTTYYLSQRGPASANITANYSLVLDTPAPPANDLFANRIQLQGSPLEFTGDLYGATWDPVSPIDNMTGNIWWEWTAAEEGYADFTYPIFPFNNLTANTFIYSPIGSPPTAENPGRRSEVLIGNNPSPIYSFRTRPGERYIIGAAAPAYASYVQRFSLSTRPLAPPPANDDFANRIQLQGSEFQFSGALFGSTFDSASDPGRVAASADGGSLWWTWTAPANGRLRISMTRPEQLGWMQPYFAVFSTATPTLPTAGDLATDFAPDQAEALVVGGHAYVIGLFGTELAARPAQLTATFRETPPNDRFSDRIVLEPGGQEFSGSVSEAGLQPGEGDWRQLVWWDLGYIGSVWWSWTPPANGFAVITVLDRPSAWANPGLFVRRADSLEAFFAPEQPNVASLQALPWEYAAFPVAGGQAYTIAMIGNSDVISQQRMRLTFSQTPIILRHPQNKTVRHGGSIFFHVDCPGTYRGNITWQFNGADIPNRAGATFQIDNATAANAGLYRAVLRAGEAVTYSEPATLTVEGEPANARLSIAVLPTLEFSVRVDGEPDNNYIIEASSNFSNWGFWLNFGQPYGPNLLSGVTGRFLPTDFNDNKTFLRAFRRGNLRERCICNLQRIYLAKEEWRIIRRASFTSYPPPMEVDEYFPEEFGPPRCLQGGSYAYGFLNSLPVCSIADHMMPIPP